MFESQPPEDDDTSSKKSRQQQPSFSARRLESFPAPDLEVLVGPKDRIYRYHALILASHSGFVDKILSSPMGVKNQEQRRVEFPDIDEETWEKMISFLEPGGRLRHLGLECIEQILPFYEQYQFSDGLRLLDDIISEDIFAFEDVWRRNDPIIEPEKYLNLGVMCYELAPSLPKSSKMAVAWATKVLNQMTAKEEDTIRELLPMVENDEKLLQTLVKIIKGRHYRDMRVDEMRSLTRAETFPGEVLLKTKQIDDVEENMSLVRVDKIETNYFSESFGRMGLEKVSDNNDHNKATTGRGAMRHVYKEKYPTNEQCLGVLESLDPFGLVWELYSIPRVDDDNEDSEGGGGAAESENGEENEEEDPSPPPVRRVLYRWDCGYSSTFPPKHGWKRVDEASEEELELDYQLKSKTSHY